ncbi:MAG: cytochrome c3 family protein [Candidatus Aminicenantales bacterium]
MTLFTSKSPKAENLQKRNPLFSSRAFIVFFGMIALLFLIILILRSLWGGTKQPIAFSHKIHKENDLDCLDCHSYYKDQAFSGRPSLETCLTCHEEPLGESKEEKKFMEYARAGLEIEWQRLYRVPEDVYFSHRRHVVLGNVECRSCHGDIGESSRPPSKPLKITMEKCMKCHERNGVSNDCIACHR